MIQDDENEDDLDDSRVKDSQHVANDTFRQTDVSPSDSSSGEELKVEEVNENDQQLKRGIPKVKFDDKKAV